MVIKPPETWTILSPLTNVDRAYTQYRHHSPLCTLLRIRFVFFEQHYE